MIRHAIATIFFGMLTGTIALWGMIDNMPDMMYIAYTTFCVSIFHAWRWHAALKRRDVKRAVKKSKQKPAPKHNHAPRVYERNKPVTAS